MRSGQKVLPFRRPDQPVPNEEQLTKRFHPLVTAAAARLRRKHDSYDYDTLVLDGQYGLLLAIRRFDPANGVTFKTYATYRIRGAMLDGIRRDHVSAFRHEYTEDERAAYAAADEHDRLMAESCGAVLPTASLRRKRKRLQVVSIDDAALDVIATVSYDPFVAPGSVDPIMLGRLQDLLSRKLTKIEQTVIQRVYFDGASFSAVARELDVNPGTVWRIHSVVLAKLRRLLLPTDPSRMLRRSA